MDEKQHREREHFFGAAKLIAGLTLLSRLMGMFRAMAIASLGAVRANDAFSMAFRIPNLFRRLFGEGALSAAFVPVFTETIEKKGLDQAVRLLSNALGLLGVVLLSFLVLILAGLAGWACLGNLTSDQYLLVGLTATMLPFMVTVCLLALASAALNCRGHFAYPAAAPVILNLVVIAAAWLVAPALRHDLAGQLYIISASVSVAGLLELVGVVYLLRKYGFSVRPTLWPIEPGIRAILRSVAPMLLGLGLLQIVELLETVIAWILTATPQNPSLHLFGCQWALPLHEGVLVRIDAARYLYQFPMGVLANSLAVVVFPLLSRYGSRGDMPNFKISVNRALRLAFMEGLAAGAGLFILAEPITALLYQRRNFTAADTQQSAFILQMYVLGMWAYCTYQIVTRAFYSLKDTRTPLKVSCALMLLELLLITTLVWVPSLQAGGFGLTTSIVFSINVLVLTILLRRRLGPIGGRRLLTSALRSIVACAVMAAVLCMIRWAFGWHVHGRALWMLVGVAVPSGAAVFVATAWLLRSPEIGELLGAMRRKKTALPPDSDQ